jgi:hypothetical protein
MRRLPFVVALLWLAGCRVPPPAVRPYPPPTAEQLLSSVRARDARIFSLRAETKVEEKLPNGQHGKVKVSILAARVGKLRLEAEGPLGSPVATLTSDGNHFALLDTRQNRFLVGSANACNVARLIQIEIEPESVVEVLLGGAPLPMDVQSSGVSWDPSKGGREVLELRSGDGAREVLRLDSKDRQWDVVEGERYDARGRLLWRLRHESFEAVGGVRLPRLTTFEQPPRKATARIKFRELEPNVTPPEGVFEMEPPSGIAPELVICN